MNVGGPRPFSSDLRQLGTQPIGMGETVTYIWSIQIFNCNHQELHPFIWQHAGKQHAQFNTAEHFLKGKAGVFKPRPYVYTSVQYSVSAASSSEAAVAVT